MKVLTATVEGSDAVLAERVHVADNLWSRFWGLMGRRALADSEALLISPCYSVHTMFMRFPIDVIFLDGDTRVLKVARALKPFRAAVRRGARSVLELNPGAASAAGVSIGSRVLLTEGPRSHDRGQPGEDDPRSP